ncbi:MAG: STAS domain-containing protein [Clostridia bacterium]|nr:STAS domain-containing protein [Clostridia bacterium]MBQ1994943.1 STAS domain-containing protein [Clostridia bacterium]MBQ5905099.1 STAS domain-containing protein [Clostridia bacterium]
MNINIEKENGITLMKIEGRLDTTTAPELEKAINNEGDALKSLTLDFKGVDYISSAGLRVLLSAQKKMNVQGYMELIGVSEAVMDVFEMTGFADILVIK